jgi:alcohol dehydrogenase
MKIRAAVMYEQGKPAPYAQSRPLVVENVELDGPGPGELLVQIAAAGLCHSDLSAIAGLRPRAVPAVVGHEAAAIVREVGEGVTDFKPGDHVVMVFVASCGHCVHCYSGRPNLCESSWGARARGTLQSGARRLHIGDKVLNHYTGLSVFAEYAVVSRNSLVRIGPDIPLEDAAIFGCAVITGVGAVVNTAKVPFGSTVAVIGLGGVGLSALLGAHVCGASRVIAIDVSEEKLCLARQLGATDTFNARDPKCVEAVRDATSGGVGFAFEMAGVPAALTTAYAILRRGGLVVVAGLPDANHTFSIPVAAMVSDERGIKGSYMGSCVPQRDIPMLLELYRRGRLPVNRLRSGSVSLDNINEGFDRLARGETVRDILVFDGAKS